MCVIIICPDRVRPDEATVRACWQANPHGGGVAWRSGGEVHWQKTDSPQEMSQLLAEHGGEVIAHFRIASVGGVCRELRHPFPVSKRAGLRESGKAKAVLFQNGTWTGYAEALECASEDGHAIPEGPMSDSRAAAFLCSVYGSAFLAALTPSRWVFFSEKKTKVFGAWETHCGMRFSNMFWTSRKVVAIDSDDEIERAIDRMRKAQSKRRQIAENEERERAIAREKTDRLLGRDQIPGATERAAASEERELFDMSGQDAYWKKLASLPKPKKPSAPLPEQKFAVCSRCEANLAVVKPDGSHVCPQCRGQA